MCTRALCVRCLSSVGVTLCVTSRHGDGTYGCACTNSDPCVVIQGDFALASAGKGHPRIDAYAQEEQNFETEEVHDAAGFSVAHQHTTHTDTACAAVDVGVYEYFCITIMMKN